VLGTETWGPGLTSRLRRTSWLSLGRARPGTGLEAQPADQMPRFPKKDISIHLPIGGVGVCIRCVSMSEKKDIINGNYDG